jgi:glutathione peroxidase
MIGNHWRVGREVRMVSLPRIAGIVGLAALCGCASSSATGAKPLSHTAKDISGQEVDLARYRGRVVMIVNVASKCGFTPQYAALESIYGKYKARGFMILGFPSNDFLWQEPGTNEEIKAFCSLKYNVTFDMFAKVSVRGKDASPVYRDLIPKKTNGPFGGAIKWNFTKFLVARDGAVVARSSPITKPDDPEVIAAIEKELARTP